MTPESHVICTSGAAAEIPSYLKGLRVLLDGHELAGERLEGT